jgi:o-succinylbenzoate---CoA ligase
MALITAHIAHHTARLARPFVTARGEVTKRPAALLRLTCGQDAGFGEACPLEGFSTEGFAEAAQGLTDAARRLEGRAVPATLAEAEALAEEVSAGIRSVRYAVECALLGLMSHRAGIPLARLLNPAAREGVEVNATLGAADAARCYAQALGAASEGYRCFKVKVGAGTLAQDMARVRAVREAVGDAAVLRLDANGAWGVEEAAFALAELARYGVSLVEQPAGSVAACGEVRGRVRVRIAADEAVRSEADALDALGYVDVLVLKPALLGGLLVAQRIHALALARGVRCIVTTLLDGVVGRTGALQLACALDELEGACGLATGALMEGDAASGPPVERGWMGLPAGAGLGVVPEVRWREPDATRELKGTLVPNPLLQRERWMADHAALVSEAGVWSYARLGQEARRVAAGLMARGVAAGEVVGVVGASSAAMVATLHGISLAGCVIAALHPRLTGEEAARLAWRAGCAVVLADAAWLRERPEFTDVACGAPVVGLAEVVAGCAPAERVATHVGCDEPHALLFTSGTTGTPKMAILTWGNQLFSAMGSAGALGHLPGDVWGAPLPLCHVGGLAVLMRCAVLGTTVRLYERFDAAEVADALVSGELTLVSLVSRMCWDVVEALGSRRPSERVRGVLLGGGAIPAELLEACAAAGLKVAPTYGMTEGCSQLVTGSFEEVGAARTNAPIVWTELRVEGEESTGELSVKGPTVSPGYARVRRPGEPICVDEALSVREGGWFGTGDWVELGAGGLKVLERRTDLIVSGGENVYPAEVEGCLRAHGAVAEACVVGLPDVRWGARVAAVLVARGEQAPDAELEAHCRAKLAGFKTPRVYRWWEELPRSSLDKVSRSQVRERLMRELEATRGEETP